jgi:Protein of unknown function (DUF1064)
MSSVCHRKFNLKAPRLKRRKYHNIPTLFQGERYDSRAEAARAAQLVLLQKGGKIHHWTRGRKWMLLEKGLGRRAITYTGDFDVYPDPSGAFWVEDVKGVRLDRKSGKMKVRATQMFRLRLKLFLARYPGQELRVVDKDGTVHEKHRG